MNGARGPKTRLETWKEVAAFFGRTERTVKRWEKERGLPVHRLPGAARSRIYADVAELEAWLASADTVIDEAGAEEIAPATARPVPDKAKPAPIRPPVRRGLFIRILAGVAALLLVTVMAYFLREHFRPQPEAPSAAAEAVYLEGLDALNAGDSAARARAILAFREASELAPTYAQAHVGLANAYLNSLDVRHPETGIVENAEASARKALALDGRLAPAHAALALSRYYGAWDARAAKSGFRKAIAQSPDNALTLYAYGHFLMLRGQLPEALSTMNKALALNPSSAALKADRALLLGLGGQTSEAVDALNALILAEPGFDVPYLYLGELDWRAGRDQAALTHWLKGAEQASDKTRISALQAGLRILQSPGTKREDALRAMLASYLIARDAGQPCDYDIAALYSALSEPQQALRYLEAAQKAGDPRLARIALDPRFDALMPNAAFKAVRARFQDQG